MLQTSEITTVFDAPKIAERIAELGRTIRADAGDSEVFLLGILKGASLFLADLLRAIDGNVSYGFIDVIRDNADQQLADALEIDFLSFTDIRNRNVYVLKDVVSTGIIENYLFGQLRSRHPASLRLVALLDRPDARTIDIRTDFAAFTVAEGTFVGYGLEQEGRYGNLPWVGRIAG